MACRVAPHHWHVKVIESRGTAKGAPHCGHDVCRIPARFTVTDAERWKRWVGCRRVYYL